MTTTQPVYPVAGADTARARTVRVVHSPIDQLFRHVTRSGGTLVLIIMGLVGAFLTKNALQAIHSVGVFKFVTTQKWAPETNNFGIAAMLTGTCIIALVALVMALPLSIGASLFITEVAAGKLRTVMTSTVDLMAAIPSVVYGLWGLAYLQVHITGFSQWISTYFGWIPIFHVDGADPSNPLPNTALYTSSYFIAGMVVAMMIIPTMTSMMREAFSRAPVGEREGAYALGATRWGMIRSVVFPFGRGGMIGGMMLGLGRALGETIAVYLILSPVFQLKHDILSNGGDSISMTIALRYGEANGFGTSALMAAGLALFILTMIINFTASSIMARSRSGADSEG